jgi:hypothetical protein
MANDMSARPHEILNLKIKDIIFKSTDEGIQYAEVLIRGGKTKPRTLPIIDSLPYLKEWLQHHPTEGNRDSWLFVSLADANTGTKLNRDSLLAKYQYQYKAIHFPRLLQDQTVSEPDKAVIRNMLTKPWNLYVFRHSALTEKSQILTESTLRDHAGWTMTSKMPTVYVHYFGTESAKKLLEAKGIIQRNSMSVNVLKAKPCPNCSESNKPDSKFCSRCKFVLSYDAFNEAIEEKEKTAKEAEESKKRLEELEAKQEILQANTASVLNALMATEMGIKSPEVKIIAWRSYEGQESLFEAAAIARAENEAREKEHQQKHHKR